jgi:hypothetical protein
MRRCVPHEAQQRAPAAARLSAGVRPLKMKRHYAGLTKQMLSEMETISDQMSHAGEKGRNNENILTVFLRRRLPKRYTVSTGKVIATGGSDSGQIDIIIHDREETPGFIDAHAWSLVPVESVYAVISVKTTLNKRELEESLQSIASVRSLTRKAALILKNGSFRPVVEKEVLRPRALVFAFKSGWKSFGACQDCFSEQLPNIHDDLRPNGICILDQGFVVRRAYTLELLPYTEHPLLHFFLFLVKTMDRRPRYRADLSKYFSDDYGQPRVA